MAISKSVGGVLCLLALAAPLSWADEPSPSVSTRAVAGRTEIVFEGGIGVIRLR